MSCGLHEPLQAFKLSERPVSLSKQVHRNVACTDDFFSPNTADAEPKSIGFPVHFTDTYVCTCTFPCRRTDSFVSLKGSRTSMEKINIGQVEFDATCQFCPTGELHQLCTACPCSCSQT